MTKAERKLLTAVLSLIPVACKIPEIPVKVETPEALKVDINMRVDVYQYDTAEGGKKPDTGEQEEYAATVERQRNRMQEIQNLKNNRLVGEDHRGLLTTREASGAGWDKDYLKQVVDSENDDRLFVQRYKARTEDKQLHEVQGEDWARRTEKAFPGEWIEVAGKDPGSYEWTQAGGVGVQVKLPDKPTEAPTSKAP